MTAALGALLERREVLLAGLSVSVLLLVWLARRVRRLVRSERPDEPLSNLAMLVGLGWSSEAVWEITGRLDWPLSLRLLLFFVLESLLVLSMIRAKRAMRELGHPGRSGRTVWIVAAAMSLVAIGAAHSFGEAVLRLVIPLLLTLQWWDGLVGEGARRREDATSWRWTPRRLLLWLGAIEPGERDVEAVHRERLTQQMTRLYFDVRHGPEGKRDKRAAKLHQLSLVSDDEIVSEVRRRVDRASWFQVTQPDGVEQAPVGSKPVSVAASERSRRVRHHRLVRTVRVTHPKPDVVPVQEVRQDPRATHEIEHAVRVMRAGDRALSQRRIAYLLGTSEPKVRRALRRDQNPEPPARINGHDIESAPV